MIYKYKKGKYIKGGKESFCFSVSSNELDFFSGGISKKTHETGDINVYINFCKEENADKIILIDIDQSEYDLIIDSLKDSIKEIELHYIKLTNPINHDKLALCSKLTDVLIECYRGKVLLWNVGCNSALEKLEITGVEKIYNQIGLKKSTVKELIIKNRKYNLDDTNKPIIDDFSIFETMPNLKTLNLFVGKKKNKEDDLIKLSRLINIEKIILPKNYFYFNQFAWLSSKLPNVKGIGCIKEVKWNKQIEKNEYTINGTRMPWQFKDYWGDGINKYLDIFNELIEKYKNEINPPIK